MNTSKTTIRGIDCYGTPAIGMNYECIYEDEYMDGIVVDIEATSWTAVLKQLNTNGLVEVVAV